VGLAGLASPLDDLVRLLASLGQPLAILAQQIVGAAAAIRAARLPDSLAERLEYGQ